jgi:hypothetical protein
MEAIMQILSDKNPVFTHITFSKLGYHSLEELHSTLTATIARIVRWSIVGICVLAIALPVAISVTSSI